MSCATIIPKPVNDIAVVSPLAISANPNVSKGVVTISSNLPMSSRLYALFTGGMLPATDPLATITDFRDSSGMFLPTIRNPQKNCTITYNSDGSMSIVNAGPNDGANDYFVASGRLSRFKLYPDDNGELQWQVRVTDISIVVPNPNYPPEVHYTFGAMMMPGPRWATSHGYGQGIGIFGTTSIWHASHNIIYATSDASTTFATASGGFNDTGIGSGAPGTVSVPDAYVRSPIFKYSNDLSVKTFGMPNPVAAGTCGYKIGAAGAWVNTNPLSGGGALVIGQRIWEGLSIFFGYFSGRQWTNSGTIKEFKLLKGYISFL